MPMRLLSKLIKGNNPARKSRLHSQRGDFVGCRMLRTMPPAIWTGMVAKLTGKRPQAPWIPYSAAEVLKAGLTKDSVVLEYGSGQSTIWLARHAGKVISLEHYEPWYERVTEQLAEAGLNNVEYRLETTDHYHQFPDDPQVRFDLIIVDGVYRNECSIQALKLLKPGGMLYVDDTDKTPELGEGTEMAKIRQRVIDHHRDHGGRLEFFVDFSPAQFFVKEGLIYWAPEG